MKLMRFFHLVRAHPGVAALAGGLILASWFWALVGPGIGGPWKIEGWGTLTLVAILLTAAYGGAAWAGLAVRRAVGDGSEVTWTAWKDLLSDWGGLTIRLVLWGALALVPLMVPALAAGLSAGWTGAPADPQGGAPPGLPARAATTVMLSSVGAFYLWSYPALVFFPELVTSEVLKWARGLARRTWPLALGWGLLNLTALAWAPGSRGEELWSTFLSTLSLAFVTAQTYLLADASKRPGFGP